MDDVTDLASSCKVGTMRYIKNCNILAVLCGFLIDTNALKLTEQSEAITQLVSFFWMRYLLSTATLPLQQ